MEGSAVSSTTNFQFAVHRTMFHISCWLSWKYAHILLRSCFVIAIIWSNHKLVDKCRNEMKWNHPFRATTTWQVPCYTSTIVWINSFATFGSSNLVLFILIPSISFHFALFKRNHSKSTISKSCLSIIINWLLVCC